MARLKTFQALAHVLYVQTWVLSTQSAHTVWHTSNNVHFRLFVPLSITVSIFCILHANVCCCICRFARIIIPEFCACFWTRYYCTHMTVWLYPRCESTSCHDERHMRATAGTQAYRAREGELKTLFCHWYHPNTICIIPEAIDCCFVTSSIRRICIPHISAFLPRCWCQHHELQESRMSCPHFSPIGGYIRWRRRAYYTSRRRESCGCSWSTW